MENWEMKMKELTAESIIIVGSGVRGWVVAIDTELSKLCELNHSVRPPLVNSQLTVVRENYQQNIFAINNSLRLWKFL